MMKMTKATVVGALALASGVVQAVQTVPVAFDAKAQQNYEGKTRIVPAAAANGFTVTCLATQKCETAWLIPSKKLPVAASAVGYAAEFEIKADRNWITPGMGEMWGTALVFEGADGNRIEKRLLNLPFHKGGFAAFRFVGKVPPKAAFAVLEIGVDGPDLPPNEQVVVRNARFSTYAKGERVPAEAVPDIATPMVVSRFQSPSEDVNLRVRYEITDNDAVDWSSVVVSNVSSKSAIPFERVGNVIALKPGTAWSRGIHALTVTAADRSGNRHVAHKVFLIGKSPSGTPRTTLRRDGALLVDGKPVFPVGLFSVSPGVFNGWNLDRAVSDLKAAGFNLMHTYSRKSRKEFLDAVAKHGLIAWVDARSAIDGDEWFVHSGRKEKGIAVWYIGDDTSRYATPSQLNDRDEAVKMLDGTRLSCQADVVCGGTRKTCYHDYVRQTDVFLPELYPVHGNSPKEDERCVASVIRDMKRCREDIAQCSGGKPRALWPILQVFHGGRLWKRYPTTPEVNATSFAALIHGANGITWFHYAGALGSDSKNTRYSGPYRDAQSWRDFTTLTKHIAELGPVLLEPTPKQPKTPDVVSGEKSDPAGNPPVSVLVKEHAGSVYVLAVNAAPKPVKAKIYADVPDGAGTVLWENRQVTAARGAFTDDFAGFGVHVYRFAGRERAKNVGDWPLIAFDDDGCDIVYYPNGREISKDVFLGLRHTKTAGTKTGAICYCPISSGFGNFTVPNDAGMLTASCPDRTDVHNAAAEFAKKGLSGLGMSAEYCHANGKLSFLTVRVNDTHDAGWSGKPHFLFPKFKQEHPDCLFGTPSNRPPLCAWSAVDFARPEVRERMVRFMRSFFSDYPIDGVVYDFCRHSQLFRTVAMGGVATDGECALMTELMRTLRKMASVKVMIRTPDSVGYCKAIGIDLEQWFAEGLVDAWCGTSYYRLQPWKESADFAHSYGVRFVASMDESRITPETVRRSVVGDGKNILPGRRGFECYAGRFAAAMAAGCDGLYVFNLDDVLGQEAGRRLLSLDPRNLDGMDKLYFATVRATGGYTAQCHLANGMKYSRLPRIDPADPVKLDVGGGYRVTLEIGDDCAALAKSGRPVRVVARALTSYADAWNLGFAINGREFRHKSYKEGLYTYEIDPLCLRKGENEVRFSINPGFPTGTILYDFSLETTFGKKEHEEKGRMAAFRLGEAIPQF